MPSGAAPWAFVRGVYGTEGAGTISQQPEASELVASPYVDRQPTGAIAVSWLSAGHRNLVFDFDSLGEKCQARKRACAAGLIEVV